MQVKHTPGPWTQGKYREILDENGVQLVVEGVALSSKSTEETRANARLIAAAPDLLYELRVARYVLQDFDGLTKANAHSLARRFAAVIAKATGGQS